MLSKKKKEIKNCEFFQNKNNSKNTNLSSIGNLSKFLLPTLNSTDNSLYEYYENQE